MLLRTFPHASAHKSSARSRRFRGDRRLIVEPLEDRRLLSLVGVSPTYPTVTFDASGPLSYNANSQALSFQLDAIPLAFRQSASTPNRAITAPSDFSINIHVGNQGQLIGGVPGPDLTVTGNVDVNGDGVVDYSGTLLTGEVTQFGYLYSGTSTSSFDFRFTPTGGPLASFYAGSDLGVKVTSENSTFTGSFATSFSGATKGTLGSVSALWSSLSGYVYDDANNDGIKQAGEAGIPTVAVTLTGADVGGNPVSLTTSTDSSGAYSFPQLRPGTYTVAETQPAGWLDGQDTQGTPGTGTTGNDVFSNIVLGAGVNGQDNNFGELPMLPGIQVEKTTSSGAGESGGSGGATLVIPVGSPVTWTYDLTNTGNTPLANVSVVDDQGVALTGPSGDTNNNGLLDVGETWLYTGSGVAQLGNYSNTAYATATATDATGTVVVTVHDQSTSSYVGGAASVELTKLTDGAHDPNVLAGSTVTWTYTLTNHGNMPVYGVTLADDDPGVTPILQSGDDNDPGVLDPGETWVYTATGAAIAGTYTNTATAIGVATLDNYSAPIDVTATDGYFGVAPAVKIVKLTNGLDNANPSVAVGSTVTWTYNVTNTGNVALSSVAVSDSDPGVAPFYLTGDDGNGVLDPGETWVFAAVGTAVAGEYSNTGTATAVDATGTVTTPVSSSEGDSYFGVAPALKVVKLTNGLDNANANLAVGSAVTWTYDVTNTGNVALTGVTVSDSDPSVQPVYQSGDNGNGLLDPGETWVYKAAGAAVAGEYSNTGTATAIDVTGAVTTPVSASEGDSYFGVQPGIQIVKLTNGTDNNAAPGAQVVIGSTVTWTYDVSNSGNVPLSNVTVSDSDSCVHPAYQSGDSNGNGLLDTGEVWVYTATGTAKAGQYVNTGTATGKDSTATVPGTVSSSDVDYYFGQTQTPASKSGYVYIDANDDGIKQSGEAGIKGVKIILTGTNDLGQTVRVTTTTDSNGYYLFTGLRPGTYTVTEIQPTATCNSWGGGWDGGWGGGGGCTSVYMYQWCEGGVQHFEIDNPDGSVRSCSLSANSALLNNIFSQLNNNSWNDDSFNWDDQALCNALQSGCNPTQHQSSDCAVDDFFKDYFTDFWNGVQTCCKGGSTKYLDGKTTPGSDGGTAGDNVISNFTLTWGENGVNNNFGELLPASVSGNVYVDSNNDGIKQSGEKGIAGTKVTLSGADDLGNAVQLTTFTNCKGAYSFGNLRPGTYTITETQPACYVDGKDTIGTQGGTAGNDVLSGIVLASGVNGAGNNFGELKPASLAGFVYLDKDNDGNIDCSDRAIAGVTVTLTGTDDRGNSVSMTTVTDDDGAYAFNNLRPGTYAITETPPAGYIDGIDSIGSQGGTAGKDQFTNIALQQGVVGVNNNFAELLAANSALHEGQTATIGFWNSCRGQALIKSLNGGCNSTQLGNWLATMFPNMYGASAASHNLAGKTNSQIASYFSQLFNVSGMKIDAQALAVSLAIYVTNSNLAGNVAAQYGFCVTSAGTGAATCNIGNAGQAFNVANNSILSILAIMQDTNNQTKKGVLWDLDGNGSFSSAEQLLRNLANTVFTDINEAGDIC